MRLNDRVEWHKVFGEYIKKPDLADPGNPKRHVFVLTMLFLEAGLRELDDQIAGRVKLHKEGMEWARITRETIVKRAAGLLDELPPDQRRDVQVGLGGFTYRWCDLGGMARFFMCMIRYACTDPRWCRILGRAPAQALSVLPRVRTGELTLSELIDDVARRSLLISVRLARCWLFPLLLTMDTEWRHVGNAANRELLDDYTARWVPVYQQAIDELGVALRPDMDTVRLSREVASQIHGSAMDIAGKGEIEEGDTERFVHAVQSLIYASIDPGDGKDLSAALTEQLDRSRGGRS